MILIVDGEEITIYQKYQQIRKSKKWVQKRAAESGNSSATKRPRAVWTRRWKTAEKAIGAVGSNLSILRID